MAAPVIDLSQLAPLQRLRLRTAGAYAGTITDPGPFVSDGKLIFAQDRVPDARASLARDVETLPNRRGEGLVSQKEARRIFSEMAQAASRKAVVLGQIPRPPWLDASDVDHVAVLRYGRGGSTRYVFVDAHRLLLLVHLFGSETVRCEGPGKRMVLYRGRRAVAGMTSLQASATVVS